MTPNCNVHGFDHRWVDTWEQPMPPPLDEAVIIRDANVTPPAESFPITYLQHQRCIWCKGRRGVHNPSGIIVDEKNL